MKQVQTKKLTLFITINDEINDEIIKLSQKLVEEIKEKFPLCKANFFVATAVESDPTEPRPDPLNA